MIQEELAKAKKKLEEALKKCEVFKLGGLMEEIDKLEKEMKRRMGK